MPSLYETTAIVGDVSSSNFTTLYNSSGLSAPNSGGGAISGNLNVAGNLTVQGASLLQGAVTLGSTLSLPNYTFPLPDGTTDQVLVTDGSGNLYWTDVSAIPGAAYSIQAGTATGGANLTLVDSAGGTDSVKFAGGTNITVTRTDANTITISTTADDIPSGTAQGQVLYWDGSAWVADNKVTSIAPADRFVAEYLNTSTAVGSSAFFRRNYGSTAYTTGMASAIGFQFDSDSQANITMGAVGTGYDSANPSIFGATSLDNFATRTIVFDFDSNDARLAAGNLVLNYDHTGTPTDNVSITVERGSSTDATLTWDESQDRWEFSNALEVQGQITGTSNLDLNGNTITLISGAGGAPTQNAAIIVDRGSSTDATLTWNETLDRFEFNESLFSSTANEPPAQFERSVTSAEINNPQETKSALRLTERVTDAVSNATDQGGAGIVFSRASGTTPGSAEALYANIASIYYGTTNTADIAMYWTNDNFSEPTPGNFPGTYRLFRAGSNDSEFLNDSLFIDYSAPGTTRTATSITGGNTLVFGSAHGLTAGQRIQFTSTTQNNLTQNAYYYVLSAGLTATQCQLGLTSTGSAVALTNGTGLTLNFVNLVNRVGINTAAPGYTLDVDGDANVSGDIYISGYQVDINSPVAGDVITFDGTKFINNTTITATNPADRLVVQYTDTNTVRASSGQFRRNYGSTAYSAGMGSAIGFQFDSDSQAITTQGLVGAAYDAANPSIFGATSVDNFTTRTIVYDINSTDAKLAAGRLILNYDHTSAAVDNAVIEVERGTDPNATITWNESQDRWEISNDLAAPQASIGNIDIARTAGQIDTNGGLNLTLDSDGGTVFVNDNLNVDAGVLYVDAANNRVGVNTTTPGVALQVDGTIWGTDIVALGTVIGTNGNLFQFNNEGTVPAGDSFIRVAGGVSVGVNSDIKWNDTTKRWQTTTDGSTYLNIPNQNLDTTDNVTFASVTVDGGHTVIDTTTTTTTSTAQTAITTTSNSTTRSSKFQIQVTDNVTGNVHVLEAMMFFQGTTAYLTTYAEMYNSTSLATFAADVSGGNTRLLATAASANNTTFKVTRISVAL